MSGALDKEELAAVLKAMYSKGAGEYSTGRYSTWVLSVAVAVQMKGVGFRSKMVDTKPWGMHVDTQ